MRVLAPSQLDYFRRTVNDTLTARCSVTRAGILLNPQPTMPNGSDLRCRVSADKDQTIPGADATQTMRRWVITLPDACPVQVLDQITALNTVYSIVEIANPTSYSVSTTVYAYALYPIDDQGNPGEPLYLRFNAVVTTKAGAVVKLSNVGAMIGEPDARALANYGGIVKHVVKLAPQSDVNNVRPGDQLYIESWGANAVDSTKPLYVVQENPDGPLGMEFHRLVISDKQQR